MNITTLNLLVCFAMVAVTGTHVMAWKKFRFNAIMAMVVGACAFYGAIAVWAEGGDTLAYTGFLAVYLVATQINIAVLAKGSDRAVALVTKATDLACGIALGAVAYQVWAGGDTPTALIVIFVMAMMTSVFTWKANAGAQAKALYLKH
jgi:hypothetical protein